MVDAIAAYTVAYHAGSVKANPEPNSIFWTKPLPAFHVGEVDTLTSSEEALLDCLHNEDGVAQKQLLSGVTTLLKGLRV